MTAARATRLVCMATMLISCAGGSETGNPATPPTHVSIGLSVRSSDPNVVVVRGDGAGAVVEHAWVALGDISFLRGNDCALLDSYPHTHPTQVATDLAAPNGRFDVKLEAGEYCAAVATLESETSELPKAAPVALGDHSIVLLGHTADGTHFTLAFPQADELELQALSASMPIAIGDGAPGTLLVFDVATWLTGIDFSSAEPDADGGITVDETRNLDLLQRFEANIDCSLELYADSDGDGALGKEDAPIARCPAD